MNCIYCHSTIKSEFPSIIYFCWKCDAIYLLNPQGFIREIHLGGSNWKYDGYKPLYGISIYTQGCVGVVFKWPTKNADGEYRYRYDGLNELAWIFPQNFLTVYKKHYNYKIFK